MTAENSIGGVGSDASFLFEKEDAPPLRLAGFVGDSIVDGPGLRCVVFCQGCPHACPGCHNPDTHPFEGGQPQTAKQLYRLIHSYPLCKGVTLSGGEPFCQAEGLLPLAKALRCEGYELAAYSGFTFERLLAGETHQRALLAQLDVLVDGPFVLAQRDLSLRFRGSANQRVLDVPASLKAGRAANQKSPRWTGEG